MRTTPSVTIGIPVFNGENFLASAIESILAQTFEDFELLISDNASTDGTAAICDQFTARDERIRCLRQETNVGAVANFNLLVTEARGQYFKWAAHDDICEPMFLEKCVDRLNRQPELAWCHCQSDLIDAEGVSWLHRLPADDEAIKWDAKGNRIWSGLPRENATSSRPSQRFAGVLLGTRWCVDSYGVIRIDVLRQTGLLPNLYGAEKVLMGELSLLGKSHVIPECLFKQRLHEHASSYQDDAALQETYTRGDATPAFASTRVSLFVAHFRVVCRASIGLRERFCCFRALVRYLLQVSKWKQVLLRAVYRRGVGGGARRVMEAGAASNSTQRAASS